MRNFSFSQGLKAFFLFFLASSRFALGDAAAAAWPARKGVDLPGPIDPSWSSAEIRQRCNPAAVAGKECYSQPDCREITVAHVEVDERGIRQPVFMNFLACQVPEADQNSEHLGLFEHLRAQKETKVPRGQIFYWVMGLVSGTEPEFRHKVLTRVAKELEMSVVPALRFESDIPLSLLFTSAADSRVGQASGKPRSFSRDAF